MGKLIALISVCSFACAVLICLLMSMGIMESFVANNPTGYFILFFSTQTGEENFSNTDSKSKVLAVSCNYQCFCNSISPLIIQSRIKLYFVMHGYLQAMSVSFSAQDLFMTIYFCCKPIYWYLLHQQIKLLQISQSILESSRSSGDSTRSTTSFFHM